MSVERWPRAQVIAFAGKPAQWTAALTLVDPTRWRALGASPEAVWGRCAGGSAEPYEVTVHHQALAVRCTCQSRIRPCKHALALLALWSDGVVPSVATDEVPSSVAEWCAGVIVPDLPRGTASVRPSADASTAPPGRPSDGPVSDSAPGSESATAGAAPDAARPPGTLPSSERFRPERLERMESGIADLLRWIDDRVRAGLARPETLGEGALDELAARLVDAQLGGMANRVRRTALALGGDPRRHERWAEELAVWHLIASAASERRLLDDAMRDAVDVAVGWQVRQADVLATAPETDDWCVMGRDDQSEERIDVRRLWLRGDTSGRWAVLLSFAAGSSQGFDSGELEVGATVRADLHRYPGTGGLRALLGHVHPRRSPARVATQPTVRVGTTLAEACREVGARVAREPWIDRVPLHVRVQVARSEAGWCLTDATGSLDLASSTLSVRTLGVLLACASEGPVDTTVEWTPLGLVPLSVHLADGVVDIGPTLQGGWASRWSAA